MVAAGSGLAVGGTADNAALEASLHALANSGADRADLALVFVTGDAYGHAHALLHAVRRVTGAPVVLGCDGVGVLTEKREVEGESAVAVLVVRSERLVATPFLLEGQGERPDLGTELAERIGATVAEGGCVLVLPDAIGCNPPALLTQLHDALGFVPVLGALAAGEPMFELHNTEVAQGALAGVALAGLTPIIGVTQGCTPIGEPYVITRAEANVIERIANRSALEMLAEVPPRLDGRRPAFGCYFDCARRGRGLFAAPDHDVALIRERLGEFPLVGFFGNGEFAPIGRCNFFHNYTGALVICPQA